MPATMLYECEGPGCPAVHRGYDLDPLWRTVEAPGAGRVVDATAETSTMPTPGYRVFCSPACLARAATLEVVDDLAAAAGPASTIEGPVDAWRSAYAAMPVAQPGPATPDDAVADDWPAVDDLQAQGLDHARPPR